MLAIVSPCVAADIAESRAAHPTCSDLEVRCATVTTPFVTPDGTLWIVARLRNRLFVTHSSDRAKTFARPVALDVGEVTLDLRADSQPKIVVDGGSIVVAYSVYEDQRLAGGVFITRSIDGGKTFSKPERIIYRP